MKVKDVNGNLYDEAYDLWENPKSYSETNLPVDE